MDSHQRGRSPSAGHHHNSSARHTPAHSPSSAHRASTPGLTGPTFDPQTNSFTNGDYVNLTSAVSATSISQLPFDGNLDFTSAQHSLFPEQSLSPADTSGLNFSSQGSETFPDLVNFDSSALNDPSFDDPLFSNTDSFLNSSAVDPLLLGSQSSQFDSVSAVADMNNMATQAQSPTPPHLLAPGIHRGQSASPHASPSMGGSPFAPPPQRHSRNSSLDPSSAAYPQQQPNEWGGGQNFQTHRRNFSDAHSDVSSAHASPYLPTHDDFNHIEHSPHLGAQDPALFDVMGIGTVSLSEQSPAHISPMPSPHISPRLIPVQHHSPHFGPQDGYSPNHVMQQPLGNPYEQQQNNIYAGQNPESFPSLNTPSVQVELPGQADATTPPVINIQFAPPSRQTSFEPDKNETAEGALSPPERARGRAKSDPFSSRGSTPVRDTLSPHAAGVGSRSPSPGGKGSRRSSTSSVPHRDYILDLADPSRPTSTGSNDGSGKTRTQKHPATFQCSLCPKRFTRAYNLRSHLRTHTDERPFVCSVCGKAFARQHDRKRHEGLHSGEKKFVCKGTLKDGNNWGCGRRFARADALGRHFRSEAGRVCIKPLMDEEAIERGIAQANESGAQGMPMMPGMVPGQQMMQPQPGYDYQQMAPQGYGQGMQIPQPQMPYRLPQALLQQYPTLGGIWDQLPSNGPDDIEGDISGRSSFDASSAGEYDEEGDYPNPNAVYSGWASDVGP